MQAHDTHATIIKVIIVIIIDDYTLISQTMESRHFAILQRKLKWTERS